MNTENDVKMSIRKFDFGYYLFGSIAMILIFYSFIYGSDMSLKIALILALILTFIFDLLNPAYRGKFTFRMILTGIIVGIFILTTVIPSPFK